MKTWPRFTHVRRKSCRLQRALLPGRDRLGTRKSPRTRGLKGVGRGDRDTRTVLLVTGLSSELPLKRVGPNSSPFHQFHSRKQVTLSLARERQGATKSTRATQTAPFLHSNTAPNWDAARVNTLSPGPSTRVRAIVGQDGWAEAQSGQRHPGAR